MSTRGAIARQTGPGRFSGVYHHWDSYPSGLGYTLYYAYREVFGHSVERMLKFLIDQHPAGWSTINGANWEGRVGYHKSLSGPCAVCGEPYGEHLEWPAGKGPGQGVSCVTQLRLGHLYQEDYSHVGPQCYCHGDRHEKPWEVTEKDAAGSGIEYVYVFDGSTKMRILSSYSEGRKVIGMFGVGDPDSVWVEVAVVDLEGPEPDWKRLDEEATRPLTTPN